MTRRLTRGILALIIMMLVAQVTEVPAFAAKTYTLEELLNVARTQATPVRTLLDQMESDTVNLKILQRNYLPDLSLSLKPATLSSNLTTDELRLQTQAGVSASITLPFGLEASTTATLNNPFNDKRKVDYSFSLKYELLPGVKTDSVRIQIDGKEQTLEETAWTLKGKLEEVQIEITNQYYTTLLSRKKLALAEEALTAANSDLEVSRELWKRGRITEQDVLDQETAVNSSKINVEQLRQQYQSNLNNLLVYAGILPEQGNTEAVQLADSIEALQTAAVKAPEALPGVPELAGVAVQNRLTHSEPYISLATAKEELGRMQNWPVINAQFDYHPESLTSGNTVNDSKWSVGISTSYAFGESGKVKLERENQLRQISQLEQQVAETRNSIYDEVQNRMTNVKVAYLNYQNAELALKRARLDQNVLDEQFKRGLITEQAQATGSRNVKTKELDLIQKMLDYQVSCWKLQQYVYLQLEQNEVM